MISKFTRAAARSRLCLKYSYARICSIGRAFRESATFKSRTHVEGIDLRPCHIAVHDIIRPFRQAPVGYWDGRPNNRRGKEGGSGTTRNRQTAVAGDGGVHGCSGIISEALRGAEFQVWRRYDWRDRALRLPGNG